jgi:hypothetical protein
VFARDSEQARFCQIERSLYRTVERCWWKEKGRTGLGFRVRCTQVLGESKNLVIS